MACKSWGVILNTVRRRPHSRSRRLSLLTPAADDSSLVKLRVACTGISAGEEITFPYSGTRKGSRTERQTLLSAVWGFECSCPACVDPILGAALSGAEDLEEFLSAIGPFEGVRNGIDAGQRLLSLYKDLRASPAIWASTYVSLFETAISSSATLAEGRRYITSTIQVMSLFYDAHHPAVRSFRSLRERPNMHPAYLILDRRR